MSQDDDATALEQFYLEMALRQHKNTVSTQIIKKATRCMNCGSQIGKAYCDTDCRDDHTARSRKKARGG